MSWVKTNLVTPIPKEISQALEPVTDLIAAILPLLSAIQSFLDIAKVFVVSQVDGFSSLANTAITALEQLVNDLFASGMYFINVDPFTTQIATGKKFDTITGLPILTSAQAIETLVSSFDDKGDAARPQFSPNATVCAFGIMVTAPTPQQFLDILKKIRLVFDWPGLPDLELRVVRYAEPKPVVSESPDWKSLRLNSIGIFADLQREINKQLAIVRGYLTTGDNFIVDLINLISRKVAVLQDQLTALNNLLNTLNNISGVYIYNVPPGVGGNIRLKRLLRDSVLEDPCVVTGFTAACLVVGGGPSLVPVDTIRTALKVNEESKPVPPNTRPVFDATKGIA